MQGKSVLSIFFTSQNPISNESKQFLLMIKDKLICIDMKFEFWILKNVHKPQSIFLWILTLHSFLFKDAINLTAMDKRSFAPPIETNWERVVNMANTCETFRINPTTTSRLIKCGFTSITLVRFISYSKCSNWCQISKLSSTIGYLFTFCYSSLANWIKIKLKTCNL